MSIYKTLKINGKNSRYSFLFFVVLLLSAVVLFCIIKPDKAGYSVFQRTWGFDNIFYYARIIQVSALVIILFIILPFTNYKIVSLLNSFSIKLIGVVNRKKILFFVISFLSIFVFYFLRIKYSFLGDYNLRLEQIIKGHVIFTEYLTMKLLYGVASLSSYFKSSPQQMFIYFSCLAGGIYVYFSFLIADLLGKDFVGKLFCFLSLICTSLILVFCGYIEVYATPFVLLIAYVYFGLRYLEGKIGIIFLVLILLLAILAHLLNLAAVPSVFILAYFKNQHKFKFITSLSNYKIAGAISVIVAAVFVFALNSKNEFVLPLNGSKIVSGYIGFFSIEHFWELLNGLILSSGLSLVIIIYCAIKAFVKQIRLSAHLYFLASICGASLFIVCLANLQRGSGDWDIMAFPAITLNILCIAFIHEVYVNQQNISNYLKLIVIGLNAINTLCWIYINHSNLSISKIENMLKNDPGTYYTKISNGTQLAIIYKINGLENDVERILKQECDKSSADLTPCIMYAKNFVQTNKLSEAKVMFEYLLEKNEFIPEAYIFLLEYYNNEQGKKEFSYYSRKLFDVFVQQPYLFLAKTDASVYLNLFEALYKNELPNANPNKMRQVEQTILDLRNNKFKK